MNQFGKKKTKKKQLLFISILKNIFIFNLYFWKKKFVWMVFARSVGECISSYIQSQCTTHNRHILFWREQTQFKSENYSFSLDVSSECNCVIYYLIHRNIKRQKNNDLQTKISRKIKTLFFYFFSVNVRINSKNATSGLFKPYL